MNLFEFKPGRARLALLLLALALASCSVLLPAPAPQAPTQAPTQEPSAAAKEPPPAPREFRAAWVATVANIDWPSRSGLPVAQQQAEISAILERASALQLNAIVLQVRPGADAIYPSALEPWSEYLTGVQGQPPQPYYDPLAQWVEQAHARGIELHAWINPYRARHSSSKSPLSSTHILNTHPEAVKAYGESLWMDPAEPAARQQTLNVVADLVRRYDLDGVHIDDYFYPYPIVARQTSASGEETFTDLDFPDEPAWQRYLAGGANLSRPDWRRLQVNQLIAAMHGQIHAIKPWVKFGISPFGLGRPERRAPGIAGFSQFDSLYADAETWLANGWLDYLAPQLYWPIGQPAQAFPTLLDGWAKENVLGRHLWPGLFTSRIDASEKSWQAQEIVQQIAVTRQHPGASGHIHFSMAALLQNRKGISERLQADSYANPALVPASPWLEGGAPPPPSLRRDGQIPPRQLRIQAGSGKPTQLFAVWKRFGREWRFFVQPAAQNLLDVSADPVLGPVGTVVVSAVDRVGNEGPRVALELPVQH
jgi:uncharacterized lipoprotein YddW (UPF0748 family)